jgi:hypothetical protein
MLLHDYPTYLQDEGDPKEFDRKAFHQPMSRQCLIQLSLSEQREEGESWVPINATTVKETGIIISGIYWLGECVGIAWPIEVSLLTSVRFLRIAIRWIDYGTLGLQWYTLTVKSGMLIDSVAKFPSALFIALNHAQLSWEPLSVECRGFKLVLGGTLTIAQMSMLSHASGTMMDLAVKKWRSFCGDNNMMGNCTSQ